jgi:hypothetical protein
MWVWTPIELLDNVSFPVATKYRCPVFMAIAIRRRENSYDAVVAVALAVTAIPMHNSNQ